MPCRRPREDCSLYSSVPLCAFRDSELSGGNRIGAFFQERCPNRRPCPCRALQLHVLGRHGSNRRCQVTPGRWHYRCPADRTASLAYVLRAHLRRRFSVHQWIPTPPPQYRACTANPLVCSSVVLPGGAGLLDGPRAVHGLVQKFSTELNRASRYADSTPWERALNSGVKITSD